MAFGSRSPIEEFFDDFLENFQGIPPFMTVGYLYFVSQSYALYFLLLLFRSYYALGNLFGIYDLVSNERFVLLIVSAKILSGIPPLE